MDRVGSKGWGVSIKEKPSRLQGRMGNRFSRIKTEKNESCCVVRTLAGMTPTQRAEIAPMADALREAGIEPTALILSPAAARLFR